ncbi:SET domain-containing protein [Actinosynnema sp. CS-041913]|uniref:SET domain-containing protein n=1 Tax=Actinosynnema sp. CS-041913 TaxID=3239917 RepID=UPI003D8AB489
MGDGYELRTTAGTGDGVFATRSFRSGETVLVGRIDRELDRNDPHASQVGEHRFVRHAGLGPMVNHSCDPNCGIRLNDTGAHDLVARRPITADQEITFDYAMRNHTVDHFPGRCRCGTDRCRGRVTGWKGLSAHRKADYDGFVAPYLLGLDARPPAVVVGDRTDGT